MRGDARERHLRAKRGERGTREPSRKRLERALSGTATMERDGGAAGGQQVGPLLGGGADEGGEGGEGDVQMEPMETTPRSAPPTSEDGGGGGDGGTSGDEAKKESQGSWGDFTFRM